MVSADCASQDHRQRDMRRCLNQQLARWAIDETKYTIFRAFPWLRVARIRLLPAHVDARILGRLAPNCRLQAGLGSWFLTTIIPS